MKVRVVGIVRDFDSAAFYYEINLDCGTHVRSVELSMDIAELSPPCESFSATNDRPHRMANLGGPKHTLWVFRGKIVEISRLALLSEEERALEVANAVLRTDRRFEELRRSLDAFDSFKRAEEARREVIPEAVRIFVWQRDLGKCVRCGSQERLEFDHIIPISKGGSNTERNIQLLCERCNREKGVNI